MDEDLQSYADQYLTDIDATQTTEPTFSSGVRALAAQTWEASPLSSIARMWEYESALKGTYYDYDGNRVVLDGSKVNTITAEDAKAKATENGVSLDFGEGWTTQEAADILIDRAVTRKERDQVITARDPYLATQLAVGLGVSVLDPLNVAAAFIPVVPEAYYLSKLGQASNMMGRAGIRAAVGAAEGVAGAALAEPIIAFAALQEGQDYGMVDSLRNLAFGGLFGAGLHTSLGGLGEVVFGRRFAGDAPKNPIEAIDRLPEPVRETLLRSTIADLIEGRPVDTGSVMDTLVAADPDLDARVSAEATLRQDGPEIDDTEARQQYWTDRLKGGERPAKPVDLRAWVTSLGGIIDRDGSLMAALGADAKNLPRGAIITAKGVARLTQARGVDYADAVAQAIELGYAATPEEFLANLRTGGKQVLNTVDREVRKLRETAAAHVEALRTAAGVHPNTKHSFAARQIVAHEQRLVQAERVRRAESAKRQAERKAPPPEPLAPVKAGERPDTATEAADTEATLNSVQGAPMEPRPVLTPEQYAAEQARGADVEARFLEGAAGREQDILRQLFRKMDAVRRLIDDLAPLNAREGRYYLEQLQDKAASFEIAQRDFIKYFETMIKKGLATAKEEETGKTVVLKPVRMADENQPAIIIRFKDKTGPRPPEEKLLPFERDVIRDRQSMARQKAEPAKPAGEGAPAKPAASGLEDETAARIAAISERLDDQGKAELAADVIRLRDEGDQALKAFDVATLCMMGF